tara:strand:+ start:295 stop:441 length:147 start_codon:yes stop_codon:yes gene_type:complete
MNVVEWYEFGWELILLFSSFSSVSSVSSVSSFSSVSSSSRWCGARRVV